MTNKSCKNCKWSRTLEVGPEPRRPSDSFFLNLLEGMDVTYEHLDWMMQLERQEFYIRCYRFPETHLRLKDSNCGEFEAKKETI